ncbi:MAG: type II CAAX prenyl endopeptidase Rce1 family protein [Spirochaetota bacterium]
MKNKDLIIYYLISIGFTWICWIPSLILVSVNNLRFFSIENFDFFFNQGFVSPTHILVFILMFLAPYGPFIASIIMHYRKDGAIGVKDLFKRIIKVKANIFWYIFIFLFPIVLTLIVMIIGMITPLKVGNLSDINYSVLYLIIYFFYMMFTSGMEEPGWRGFALPELLKEYNAEKSSYILGVFWSLWHIPFLLFTSLSYGLGMILITIIGHILLTIPAAIIYTWMYNNTKSIFLCILFHTNLNFFIFLVIQNTKDPVIGTVIAVLTWIAAAIILNIYGKKNLIREKV